MKIKKIHWIILVIFLVILVFFIAGKEEIYQFKGNTLCYSEDRGEIDYEIISKTSNNSFEKYKIKFKSRPFLGEETIIYGLLYVPNHTENEEKKG